MKRNFFPRAFFSSTLCAACAALLLSCGGAKETEQPTLTLQLTNPIAASRADEPVVISRAQLQSWMGSFPDSLMPMLSGNASDPLAWQVDDTNADGTWDEIALVANFAPSEVKTISLSLVAPSAYQPPVFTPRVNVRFAIGAKGKEYVEATTATRVPDSLTQNASMYFQMEGPGWESDRIGYRLYFDKRHAKDIFGKRTNQLILDRTGINENYHELQEWGMDVLKVGTSLGAGSVGMEDDGRFFHFGPAANGTYRLLYEGPVRASFEIVLDDAQINGKTYQMREQITIWAGQHWFADQVTVTGFEGEKVLLTGIVNKFNLPLNTGNADSDYLTFFTFGQQSENKDDLGMAVIVDQDDFLSTTDAPATDSDITETHLVRMRVRSGQPVTYYFLSAWPAGEPEIKDGAAFAALVGQVAARMNQPVQVAKSEK